MSFEPLNAPRSLSAQIIEQLDLMIDQFFYSDNQVSLDDVYDTLRLNPAAGTAASMRADVIASNFRPFSHDEPEVQEYVREVLNLAEVPITQSMRNTGHSTSTYGFELAQPLFRRANGRLYLRGFYPLDPRFIDWKGNRNGIKRIVYGSQRTEISYNKLVHTFNSQFSTPDGESRAARAVAAYRALQVFSTTFVVAAKVNATPTVVGQTEENAGDTFIFDKNGKRICGENGEPITVDASIGMAHRLQQIRASGYLTLKAGEKANVLQTQTSPELYVEGLQYLNNQIVSAMGVPVVLVYPQRTGGDSNLAKTQLELFKMSARADAELINRTYVECIVRPILRDRFPGVLNLGSFLNDPISTEMALQKVERIGEALNDGNIPEDKIDAAKEKIARLLEI